MRPEQKVVLNTFILYARVLLTAGITLYTTRLVLEVLGVEDYGIYSLVAGVVSMLAFLNAAMSASTQRYLSFYQGQEAREKQCSVFSNSLFLHLMIGLFALVLFQIAGLFLFNGFLNIDPGRMYAARVTYQFVIVSVCCTIVSVPFSASLNAHENMLSIALISIVQVLLRLWVACILLRMGDVDKLIFYAAFTALADLLSLVLYIAVSCSRYPECTLRIKKHLNLAELKELSAFAGWNLFGSVCGISRSQGLALVLNLFFGTVVNTAYAVGNQLGGYLSFFSSSMLQSMNPQIMKSEGAGARHRMLKLSMTASKTSFFLLAFLAIPCIFEMEALLRLWLKEVPPYTVSFCVLILIGGLANSLTVGLQSAIQATSRIKAYQSVVGSIQLLNLPIAYCLLRQGFSPQIVPISFVGIELLACVARMYFLKTRAGMSVWEYLHRVIFREILPVVLTVCTCCAITRYCVVDYRIALTFAASAVVFLSAAYYLGLCDDEKNLLDKLLNVKVRRK